jgi:hypothetical protein
MWDIPNNLVAYHATVPTSPNSIQDTGKDVFPMFCSQEPNPMAVFVHAPYDRVVSVAPPIHRDPQIVAFAQRGVAYLLDDTINPYRGMTLSHRSRAVRCLWRPPVTALHLCHRLPSAGHWLCARSAATWDAQGASRWSASNAPCVLTMRTSTPPSSGSAAAAATPPRSWRTFSVGSPRRLRSRSPTTVGRTAGSDL